MGRKRKIKELRCEEAARTDWRKAGRTPEKLALLKKVEHVLLWGDCACFLILCMFSKQRWAILLSFLLLLLTLAVYFAFPQYTTMWSGKMWKKTGNKNKVIHLGDIAIILIGMLTLMNYLDYYYYDWVQLAVRGAILTLAVAAVFFLAAREMREDRKLFLVAVIFVLFTSVGLVGQLNHLLNAKTGEAQPCTVTEKQTVKLGRRGMRCFCVVDAGEETVKVPVGGVTFKNLEVGDEIPVYIGEGALNVRYACYVKPRGK